MLADAATIGVTCAVSLMPPAAAPLRLIRATDFGCAAAFAGCVPVMCVYVSSSCVRTFLARTRRHLSILFKYFQPSGCMPGAPFSVFAIVPSRILLLYGNNPRFYRYTVPSDGSRFAKNQQAAPARNMCRYARPSVIAVMRMTRGSLRG